MLDCIIGENKYWSVDSDIHDKMIHYRLSTLLALCPPPRVLLTFDRNVHTRRTITPQNATSTRKHIFSLLSRNLQFTELPWKSWHTEWHYSGRLQEAMRRVEYNALGPATGAKRTHGRKRAPCVFIFCQYLYCHLHTCRLSTQSK